MPTELGSWRRGGRGGGGEEGGGGAGTDVIKSNNPHLADGEQGGSATPMKYLRNNVFSMISRYFQWLKPIVADCNIFFVG